MKNKRKLIIFLAPCIITVIIIYIFFFQDKYYLVGTYEYAKKEKNFKVKLSDAINILKENKHPGYYGNIHAFIKNNDYVFSRYIWKTGASLEGVYINGNTGEMKYIHSTQLGPFNHYRLQIWTKPEHEVYLKRMIEKIELQHSKLLNDKSKARAVSF